MSPLRLLPPLALLLCLVPPAARAQTAEHHDTETITNPSPPKSAWKGGADLDKVAGRIIDLTNAFRKEQGREPVRANAKLTRTARDFADYMARTDRFGHQADDNRPADRVAKHDYEYCVVAENIAYEYSSEGFGTEALAKAFVQGWKDSPGHRRNMLDPDVTETGVAVAQSETTGYFYAVQLFGRPASDRIEFRIGNRTEGTVEYAIDVRTFRLPPGATRIHQGCRPPVVTVHFSEKQGDQQTLKPRGGERYVVEQDRSGRFQVVKH